MNKAFYMDSIEKIAMDKEDKNRLATGALGAGLIHANKDALLGQKTLYHGTSKDNWNSIKNDGLKANKGGLGGASAIIDNDDYIKASVGNVHATGSRLKANMYSGLGGAFDKYKNHPDVLEAERLKKKFTPEGRTNPVFSSDSDMRNFLSATDKADKKITLGALNPLNRGKTIKIKMDYDKYKNNMVIDPDEVGGALINQFKDKINNKHIKSSFESFAKNQAAKGPIDIGLDEIVGRHNPMSRISKTVKNMPNYAKGNTGRFARGLGGVALGAGLLGNAINKSRKNNEQ